MRSNRMLELNFIRPLVSLIELDFSQNLLIKIQKNVFQNLSKLKNLNPLFDKVYYSSRIKLRKPNAECFHYVLNDSQFNVDETLFFDDSIQHIEGSVAAGIKALHVDNSKTILDFFDTNYKLKTITL